MNFLKIPKTFLIISQQPNISQKVFEFKMNVRISSFTSYKDHCCSFFNNALIKQQKQAEAEVVPSSSLVEVRVEFAVFDEFEVGVEVEVGVAVEVGVELWVGVGRARVVVGSLRWVVEDEL